MEMHESMTIIKRISQKNADKIHLLFQSIFSGWLIGLGALAMFSVSNRILGSLLFSIGITLVMIFKSKLYTGYIPSLSNENKIKENLLNIPLCIIGNILGTELLALYCYGSKYTEATMRATQIIQGKENLLSGLLSGISCGIVIGLIVLNRHKILKWILTPLLIMTFILSGMEHCVADAFYMGLSNVWKPMFLIAVIIGNTIGGYLVGKIIPQKK